MPVLYGYRLSSWFAWCINEHVQGFWGCPGVCAFVFPRQMALDGTVSRAFTACCGRAAGSRSACLVVVVGGRQSKGSKGKGTGFLTLASTAGLFMEAEPPPEGRSCCQLSSWNTSLAVTWSCPPLFRGWQMIWINVWHFYTCDLRSYAGRTLLVSPPKRSWFTRPRN